jgi:hypothetical protein
MRQVDMWIVKRSNAAKGFAIPSTHWIVARTALRSIDAAAG